MFNSRCPLARRLVLASSTQASWASPKFGSLLTFIKRGGVWFAGGTLRVHLGVENEFRPARKAHPAFLVQNLGLMLGHLQAAGVAVITDEPLEGYERAYISDPFGNRIELLEPLPT
jgi:catechol 2,3-dioxygenase-like lactoylglutathione lyase family enzyme